MLLSVRCNVNVLTEAGDLYLRFTVLSVVTVAGICNSVGGGVFLTSHRGAGGK